MHLAARDIVSAESCLCLRTKQLKEGDVTSDISMAHVKRTKQLGFLNFRKVPGLAHPRPYVTTVQFCLIWSYPTIVISTLAYVFYHYWW